MRFFKFLLPLLILAAGGGAFAWFKITKQEPEPLQPKNRAPTVSVQVVEKTTVSPMLRIFGQVETPIMSVLTAGVEADIIEVKVLEGNAVEQGQVMIVMDDTDTLLEILQRRAELAEIEALIESDKIKLQADKSALETEKSLLSLNRKAVERANKLAQSRAGSEATLDKALQDEQRQLLAITQRQQSISDFVSRQRQLQARLNKAEAALQRAERDQKRTQISAPFSGRIMDVMVSPGVRTNRGSQLVQLYDESQLELRAQVPSSSTSILRQAIDAGQPINAVINNSGQSIELALHRLSANVAAGQGGVDAFFRAKLAQLPVLGSTLEINLSLPPIENAVVLSPDSLYGRDRVYRVQDSMLQLISVRRLGQLTDEKHRQMLIVAGDVFAAGDQILNSRLPQAVNGLEVKVMQGNL